MADYQFSFEHSHKQPSIAVKGYNQNTYGSSQNKVMVGYIASNTDQDILEGRHTVRLEGLQTNIRASVMYPIGYTQSNGSGVKPFALEIGTPVCVQFFEESRQAIIIGTLNLPSLFYGSSIVDGRTKPDRDTNPMWRPVFSNNLMDLGLDSQITVTPMKLRGQSSYYESIVPTGVIVPGNIEVNSSTGIKYSLMTNADIKYSPISVTKNQGILKDYSDKALEKMRLKKESLESNVEKNLKRAYTFSGGLINPENATEKVATFLGQKLGESTLAIYLEEIDNAVGLALKVVNISKQFIEWANQDISFILEDLLQTFGQIDLDLDLVKIDLNLSLTSIDLNLDFRIGTGVPALDNVINAVLSTAVNTLLDNLLKNVRLGDLLGIDILSLLSNQNSVNTNKTYLPNSYTPRLRMTNKFEETLNNVQDLIGDVNDLVKLDEQIIYRKPTVYLKSTNAKELSDLEILNRYIVLVTNKPELYSLGNYLNNLYLYKSEKDILACLTFATEDSPEDKLRSTFLYAYYCFGDLKDLEYYLQIFYDAKKVNKLLNQYSLGKNDFYNNLNILLNDSDIYDPFDLDLNLFKDTLINENSKLGLDYLISGNFTEFINLVSIVHSKQDIRFNLSKYTKLKRYINRVFTGVNIGYE